MSGGLLISGIVVPVPGFTVIGPHDAKWAHLSPGDYRLRKGKPHQVILHTTKGDWPQKILPGKGPAGRAQRTAEFWSGDPTYSGAQIVIGSDGEIACLADVITIEAYHATVSNAFSIGIETYQEPNGVIYQAALDATAAVCDVLHRACGIPKQYPSRKYSGGPLFRMLTGGKDCYGFFGHRDNTDRRGRGDPGDAVFELLGGPLHGYEGRDFDAREDIAIAKRRQAKLNLMGEHLVVDGLYGFASIEAQYRRGFGSGLELDAAVEIQ